MLFSSLLFYGHIHELVFVRNVGGCHQDVMISLFLAAIFRQIMRRFHTYGIYIIGFTPCPLNFTQLVLSSGFPLAESFNHFTALIVRDTCLFHRAQH